MTRLSGYSFGQVRVDGDVVMSDVIVLPGRVIRGWRRAAGHVLAATDLAPVIDDLPETLVVGTGAWGRMRVDDELASALRARGVTLEAMPTADAVERFGCLDETRAAAALHLTC